MVPGFLQAQKPQKHKQRVENREDQDTFGHSGQWLTVRQSGLEFLMFLAAGSVSQLKTIDSSKSGRTCNCGRSTAAPIGTWATPAS